MNGQGTDSCHGESLDPQQCQAATHGPGFQHGTVVVPSGPSGLAFTGSDTAGFAYVAFFLLALGLLLVLLASAGRRVRR